MNKRKMWRVLIGFVLICGIGAGISRTLPHPVPLMKRAVRIADTSDWILPSTMQSPEWADYHWTAGGNVLFFHREPGVSQELWEWNPQAETSNHLPEFNRLLHATARMASSRITIAPDGRKALWERKNSYGVKQGYEAAAVDGSQDVKFVEPPVRNDENEEAVWMSDSRHCLVMKDKLGEQVQALTLRDLELPNARPQSLPPQNADAIVGLPMMTRGAFPVANNRYVTILDGQGSIPPRGNVFTVNDVDLAGGAAGSRKYIVHIPESAKRFPNYIECIEPAASPQGNRIAWLVRCEELAPWREWLSQHTSFVSGDPTKYIALCISNLDGSDMREVGRKTTKGDLSRAVPMNDPLTPHLLHWTTDGTRISFLYRGALWAVPVE